MPAVRARTPRKYLLSSEQKCCGPDRAFHESRPLGHHEIVTVSGGIPVNIQSRCIQRQPVWWFNASKLCTLGAY